MSTSEQTACKTISEIVKNWFVHSPVSGIRRISRAKTLFTRLFWGYSFWVFTILMSCFISIIIIYHISHPTKIHLTVQHYRDPDHFPAITFCNINPLKDDLYINDQRKPMLPTSYSFSSNISEAEYRKKVTAYMERILAEQVNGQQHPFVEWSYQLSDLLITCVFNKHYCYQNLSQIFHPHYGNCYTFNNDENVRHDEIEDIRFDWSIDDNHGDENYKLFLELFLRQRDYNPYLDQRAAFRIFIHRKQEIPMFSETSLFVGPNKYTKLSFVPRVMSFSQHCRKDLTDEMKLIFPINKVRYTQALCSKFCEHRYILQRCKCIEQESAVFYQFFSNKFKPNGSLCAVDDQCLMSRGYFNASKSCPECLPECEIIQYSVQSSYARYPNEQAKNKVESRVRNYFRLDPGVNDELPNASGGSSSGRRPRLHNNIVAIEISASPYPTEILTESPVYTWVDLISSIGGQTGLWIGVSLISLVEIMELLYLLVDRFCTYLFFCKKPPNK